MDTRAIADLEIGVAQPAERRAALEVLASALTQNEQPGPPSEYSNAATLAELQRQVEQPGTSVLVARLGGRLAGVLLMTAASEEPWRVGPIGVLPSCRGQGIGTSLMQVCRARLDAADEPALATACSRTAVTFFGRFGFADPEFPATAGVPHRSSMRRPASRSRKEQSP